MGLDSVKGQFRRYFQYQTHRELVGPFEVADFSLEPADLSVGTAELSVEMSYVPAKIRA